MIWSQFDGLLFVSGPCNLLPSRDLLPSLLAYALYTDSRHTMY